MSTGPALDPSAPLAPAQAETELLPETRLPVAELGPLRPADARYDVGAEVGCGGMGKVLRADDTLLRRPVALKLLSAPGDPEARARFLREAQLTSQLDHAAVLPVYDLGRDTEGNLFFSMKLVSQHETLNDVIERLRAGDPEAHQTYSFQRRVQLVQRVCEALHYAHQRGVVHRDIKPANVVLSRYGEVFLADWGIAKLTGEGPAPQAPEGPPRLAPEYQAFETEEGALVGTVAYMAPEQLSQGVTDALTDVYSLCALLYEFLSLHYYLGEVSNESVFMAVVGRVPKPAEAYHSAQNGRVPRALSYICARGLNKNRAYRFQSARELEQALQLWLEGSAPIVCAGTCMKRVLTTWSHAIDRRPVLAPIASFVVAALFLRWLIVTAQDLWTLLAS
ncbi:MAG: serine/threonine protein kinase [Planctomycetes bacterium]|nr:serine/threonine protein kinase [Planctomycetota bacterium]